MALQSKVWKFFDLFEDLQMYLVGIWTRDFPNANHVML